MLRLNHKIDSTMLEFFARLKLKSAREGFAVIEAIKCGIRHDTIVEIPDALLTLDPVLIGLWAQWRDAIAAEAWTAVLRTVFIGAENHGTTEAI